MLHCNKMLMDLTENQQWLPSHEERLTHTGYLMHCMLYVSAAHVIENGVIVKGNSTGCSDLGNKFHKIAAFCSVCVCVCVYSRKWCILYQHAMVQVIIISAHGKQTENKTWAILTQYAAGGVYLQTKQTRVIKTSVFI